ncbi:MAG: hypothetical protein ABI851_13815 [Saprospiraceae bacterium]
MIKLFLFYVLFSFSILAQGKLKFGIKAGVNYGTLVTSLVPPDGTPYYHQFNFIADGFIINYTYREWKLYSGYIFSVRGSNAILPVFGDKRYPQNFSFFEWPLLISRNLYSKKFRIGAGIINSYKDFSSIHLIGDRNYELDVKGFLEWDINKRFSMDFSYLYGGINNLFSKRETYLFSVMNLSISYYFLNIKVGKKTHND